MTELLDDAATLGDDAGEAAVAGAGDEEGGGSGSGSGFTVRLTNFEGPFDLLLGLIAKHKLDVTEIALSVVTDEFIDYIRAFGTEWELDQTTEFLVVAATLLDLKAARLLPQGEVEDEEDLALLEARDLLFARLLQYRAYKQIAGLLGEQLAREARRFPRAVGLEERFSGALPEVLIGLGVEEFAKLAAQALKPKPAPVLSLAHIHQPRASVREQAALVVERLRRQRSATFRALTADSPNLVTTIARFLALLELFREGAVAFEQAAPLAELTIRWSGSDDGEVAVGDEFDEGDGPLRLVVDGDGDDEPTDDFGDGESGDGEFGDSEPGAGESEDSEPGDGEFGDSELADREPGADEPGADELRAGELRAGELRAGESGDDEHRDDEHGDDHGTAD